MNKMIEILNTVLKHERTHFNFYLQTSMEIVGCDRLFIKPLLEKEMMGELEHIKMFGNKIVALGGIPTQESFTFPRQNQGKKILEQAVKMEREVLSFYHSIYKDAEKYADKYKDMSIVLLLEENIEHTTADVEEMEKIIIDM